MKKMIPVLLVMLSLSLTPVLQAETIAVLPEVMKPSALEIHNGQIFVTDKEVIHIYNLKDFKLVKTFGKQGEGPGEFKRFQNLKAYPDFLQINTLRKVMFFSRQGKFLKEHKLDPMNRNVTSIGDVFLVHKRHFERETGKSFTEFVIMDKDFKPVKSLATQEGATRYSTSGKLHTGIMYPEIRSAVQQDKIYLADSNKGFYIAIYNTKGELLKEIKREHKKQKLTEKYKTEFFNNMKKSKNYARTKDRFTFDFAEFFPAFLSFRVYPGGILLSMHNDTKGKSSAILLDLDGRLIKTGTMRNILRNTFYKGRMYYLFENEDEEQWELIAEDL